MSGYPSVESKLAAGTYVRLIDLHSSDRESSNKEKYINQVFIVGAKEDKFSQDYLNLNEKTEARKEQNYYSGPITNLNNGSTIFVGSGLFEKLNLQDPVAETIPKGTKVLILNAPGVNDEFAGKIATVGEGNLVHNYAWRPETYGGNFILSGKDKACLLNGVSLKIVSTDVNNDPKCKHFGCGNNKWNYLNVCEEHAKAIIKMPTPCKTTGCDQLAKNGQTNCSNHGGQTAPSEFYKVNKVEGMVYGTLGLVDNAIPWPNDNLRLATTPDYWGTWTPQVGKVGKLVWQGHNKATNSLIYILQEGDKFFAIDSSAVSLTEDPNIALLKKQQEEELEKKKLEVLQQSDNLKKKLVEKFKEAEEAAKKQKEAEAAKAAKDKEDEAAKLAGKNPDTPPKTGAESVINDTAGKLATEVAKNIVGQKITEVTNKVVNPQEEKMSKVQQVVNTAKADASKSGVRIARKQLLKLMRDPLVAYLAGNLGDGSESARKKAADFLSSELGEALMSGLVGVGLSTIPDSMGGQYKVMLAEELRVHGMTEVGDQVADLLMGPLRQVLSMFAGSMGPAEESDTTPVSHQMEQQTRETVGELVNTEVAEVVGVGSSVNSSKSNR